TVLTIKYGSRIVKNFVFGGTSGTFSFNIFDYAYEFGLKVNAIVSDGTFTASDPGFYAFQPEGDPVVVDTPTPNKLVYSTGPFGSYQDPECYWIENTGPKERRFFCGPHPVAKWTWTGSNMNSGCSITPFEKYTFTGGCPTAIKFEEIL